MTEDEARRWLSANFDVPRETWDRLERFVAEVIAENEHQNLISAATIPEIWARHIVDSAQLLRHAPAGPWIDLGSGPGFPGLVIAAMGDFPVTLVESRRRRADFLARTAERLGIADRVTVIDERLEQIESRPFAAISARAFAPLDRLLPLAARFATPDTIWVLPKGRSAQAELDTARITWQGAFRIEPSVTDPEAGVIVATDVRPKTIRPGKAR